MVYAAGDFCWVDLMSFDMEASGRFYCDLFGWKLQAQDMQGGPPHANFLLDGKTVAGIGQMDEATRAAGVPACWSSYLATDNVEQTLEAVVNAGGSVVVPPMTVLQEGSLAVFTDPTGATLGLWQPQRHHGAEVRDTANSVCWSELATRDLSAAAQFYASVFGWGLRDYDQAMSAYQIIEHSGRDQGGLMQMTAEWGEMPSHWAVYFQVGDCAAATARVKELGGSLIMEPFQIPVGWLGIARDPDGAVFSLMQLTADG